MQAGHPEARGTGILEVVWAGRDRPKGSTETGGGIRDDIKDGDGVRGEVGRGSDQVSGRRRGGVSGSERVYWSRVEQSGGGLILELRRARNNGWNNVVHFRLNRERV